MLAAVAIISSFLQSFFPLLSFNFGLSQIDNLIFNFSRKYDKRKKELGRGRRNEIDLRREQEADQLVGKKER